MARITLEQYDKIKGDSTDLLKALQMAENALDNALRSEGISTGGYIATRQLMAEAQTHARKVISRFP